MYLPLRFFYYLKYPFDSLPQMNTSPMRGSVLFSVIGVYFAINLTLFTILLKLLAFALANFFFLFLNIEIIEQYVTVFKSNNQLSFQIQRFWI